MNRFARPLALLALLAFSSCQRKQAEAEPETNPQCSTDADCGGGFACLSGVCVPAFNITGAASAAPSASAATEAPAPSAAASALASAVPTSSGPVPIFSGNPSSETLAQRAEALNLRTIGALASSAPASSSSGAPAVVSAPKGNATIGAVSVRGGKIEDASRVVAGMRAAFRRCYDRGLQENPDQKGGIQFDVGVGAKGEVIRVIAVPSGTVSASVLKCAQSRVQAARFAAPSQSPASVRFSVSLARQ